MITRFPMYNKVFPPGPECNREVVIGAPVHEVEVVIVQDLRRVQDPLRNLGQAIWASQAASGRLVKSGPDINLYIRLDTGYKKASYPVQPDF